MLESRCFYDRSVECHEEVLIDSGIEPNYDDSVINQGFSDGDIFARASVNEVYIYDFIFIHDLYLLSSSSENFLSFICSSDCTLKNLTDTSCDTNCNNSKCSYDFLECLKNDACYTFIIDDGNCNSLCPGEKDCQGTEKDDDNDDDDNKYLLVKILVPIFGFLIM